MNIIVGATGQIGSMLADNLLNMGQLVRAVVRNGIKAQTLKGKGAEIAIADCFDKEALKEGFHGGTTAFLLTPENPGSSNYLEEMKTMINNYREAVLSSGISRIIGLSSMGAQHESGTGNLEASYMLEHTFTDTDIKQVFIRPSYYFSNWLGYVELVKEYGILPTFFPPTLKVPMIAPPDVARFLSKVMTSDSMTGNTYEITGPEAYNSIEIAEIFKDSFKRDISVQQVMPEQWESTLIQAGFSKDAAANLILMTQAVIDGKTEDKSVKQISLPTSFKEYLAEILS